MRPRFEAIRKVTESLCAPLAIEDYGLQAMPETSPPKWHLAHTSWFFEQFVLAPFLPEYSPFHPLFAYLFNSYYESVGPFFDRPRRGLLSRPTVAEVYRYRAHVDRAMLECLRARGDEPEIRTRIELGLQHEQQHQELLLTDIKYSLAANPLRPAYRAIPKAKSHADHAAPALRWLEFPEGIFRAGHEGGGFAFDHEGPSHPVFLSAFRLASRLVTQGEYREFVEAEGYLRPELWLFEGWQTVRREGWEAPLYWEKNGDGWQVLTLGGLAALEEGVPVSHLSFYEADAFARWSGRRLPTEFEWERAARTLPLEGNFLDSGNYAPEAAHEKQGLAQVYGDLWEWTQSPYVPYPGFRPLGGSLGEYNGKFMYNQMVLRGGSFATPADHMRASYRNFFPPHARWQFTGLRLADG